MPALLTSYISWTVDVKIVQNGYVLIGSSYLLNEYWLSISRHYQFFIKKKSCLLWEGIMLEPERN